MNIADPFIRRPIMTSLIMVAILIFGLASYRQLPVNDLPNVDFPTIQVNASLSGANPDTARAIGKAASWSPSSGSRNRTRMSWCERPHFAKCAFCGC